MIINLDKPIDYDILRKIHLINANLRFKGKSTFTCGQVINMALDLFLTILTDNYN